MNQYFEVGEEVELASEDLPELNGDYVISHVIKRDSDGVYKCPVNPGISIGTENLSMDSNAISYFLHGVNITLENSGKSSPKPWKQSALRKKHPKGESFDTLMEKLNAGVTA